MRRLPLTFVLFALACGRGAEPELYTVPNAAPVQAGAFAEQGPVTVTANDLDQRTAELFGDALRLDAALPVTLDSVEIAGGDDSPVFDLDVRSFETYDRVRHYVAAFTGPAKSRIADRLSDGTRYEAMIRSKLRAGSLPEDMYYLALVESGYNPHAYSRAAAVGMWQFMATTARGMGLRVDWWIDERRDPIRSTDAAVRFLRGLNEQFGSMYLAAAAYNGGPGRIARGLNRYADDLEGTNPDEMFFTLAEKKYLRGETSNYVPQLIAAALVAKEARKHGLVIEQREPFAYDSVWVGGEVPLAAIAKASGASLDVIQELNSFILRGMTPPMRARDSIKVRVPVGAAASFDSVFATLDSAAVDGARIVRAEKNSTWATIARTHKIPAKALLQYNPKVKPAKSSGRISAGTAVMVPSAEVYAAALSVPDPSIERYGTGTRTHVVRQGENLSVIAKRYRTTPASIMRLNRLKKPMIFPGQELLVNGNPAPAKPAPKKKATTPKR
ncbi:MAG TPA: transglycosylase SLT domain-containing protein [Gemmatimonadaceae bacterium]|nr:transglycosylase SLT domain-containing protein [Gemmatimonadaceae bacterium]